MTKTSQNIQFRIAAHVDLPKIIEMLADDPLGQKRESYTTPLSNEYLVTFEAIENDNNNEIILACFEEKIVGFYQITYIPYLTYMGKWRALVEGVRVHKSYRKMGIGKELLQKAIEQAKQRGCHLIQLTTDKTRPDAIAFYNSLGFVASHEGMKLYI
jgi:ribosomal protein S18 acetylase RimI-like enzyme